MPVLIDLGPLKDEIRQRWDGRLPKARILAWIKEQGDQYATCSLSTLKRNFRKWDMKWKVPQDCNSILETVGSESLIALFYEGLSIYFRLYTATVLSLLFN